MRLVIIIHKHDVRVYSNPKQSHIGIKGLIPNALWTVVSVLFTAYNKSAGYCEAEDSSLGHKKNVAILFSVMNRDSKSDSRRIFIVELIIIYVKYIERFGSKRILVRGCRKFSSRIPLNVFDVVTIQENR